MGDKKIRLIGRPEFCFRPQVFLFLWIKLVSKFLQGQSRIVYIWGLVLVR
jgi:hypothetical protein